MGSVLCEGREGSVLCEGERWGVCCVRARADCGCEGEG